MDNLNKESYNIIEVINTLGDLNPSYRGVNVLYQIKMAMYLSFNYTQWNL